MADEPQRQKGKVKPAPLRQWSAKEQGDVQAFLDQSFSRYQDDPSFLNEPNAPGVYRPQLEPTGTQKPSNRAVRDQPAPASAFDKQIDEFNPQELMQALQEWYGPQFKSKMGNNRALIPLPGGPLINRPLGPPPGGPLINVPSAKLPSGPMINVPLGGLPRGGPLITTAAGAPNLKEGFSRDLLNLLATRAMTQQRGRQLVA
jgi:hypothetical protein